VKSYSFFILPPLALRCRPCGDDPDVVATVGVDHDNNATDAVEADRDESSFRLGMIVDGHCMRIEQHALGVGEVHAVLAQVRSGLGWIPDCRHVCILCTQPSRSRERLASGSPALEMGTLSSGRGLTTAGRGRDGMGTILREREGDILRLAKGDARKAAKRDAGRKYLQAVGRRGQEVPAGCRP
jgi:hypothetical protein